MTRPRPSLALLVLSFVAFVSLGMPDGLLGVAWPSMRRDFGVDVGQLGWFLIASMIGYLGSSFVSGWLVARLGLGRLLIVSSAMMLLVVMAFAVAPSWWWIVGFGVLSGAGGGAIDAGINAFAAERFSPAVINWLHASFGIGATLGPALMTGVLAGGWSWRAGYAVLAIAMAGMTLGFALSLRMWRDAAPVEPAGVRVADPPPAGVLRRPTVWLGAFWFLLYSGAEVTAGQWSYSLMTEQRGVEPRTAGLAVTLYWGCLTAGRIAFGLAASRVSSKVILRVTLLGAPVCAALYWLNMNPWLSMGALAVLGFLLAPMFPLMIALTPGRVGPRLSAHVVGYQISAAALGAAALPAGVGAIAQAYSLSVVAPCLLAMLVLLLLVSAAIHADDARSDGAAGPVTSPQSPGGRV